MATRISLLHSARQREERQQIGNMTTPFANSLKELEKRCLIRLSQAARGANQVQIALNSIMRAHKLLSSIFTGGFGRVCQCLMGARRTSNRHSVSSKGSQPSRSIAELQCSNDNISCPPSGKAGGSQPNM